MKKVIGQTEAHGSYGIMYSGDSTVRNRVGPTLVCVHVMACLFALLPGRVLAEEVTAVLSLKSWYTAYSYNNAALGYSNSDKNPGLMTGPSVKLGYGRAFGGISYLFSTDQTEQEGGDGSYISIKREDMDLVAGYMVLPWLGLYVGYKNAIMEKETAARKYSGTLKSVMNITGPGVGIVGLYPVPRTRLTVTGSLSYLWLKHEYDYLLVGGWLGYGYDMPFDSRSDYPGYSSEIGFTYPIAEHLGVSVGYKYQHFRYVTKGEDAYDITETFKGFTMSADYHF